MHAWSQGVPATVLDSVALNNSRGASLSIRVSHGKAESWKGEDGHGLLDDKWWTRKKNVSSLVRETQHLTLDVPSARVCCLWDLLSSYSSFMIHLHPPSFHESSSSKPVFFNVYHSHSWKWPQFHYGLCLTGYISQWTEWLRSGTETLGHKGKFSKLGFCHHLCLPRPVL